jgi:hypothetical protein
MPESLIPVAAFMSAILHITVSPDLGNTMLSDRRRKLVVPYSSPWSSIILSAVPDAFAVNEIVIPIVNDIIWTAIGYRKTIIIQIDEIRSVRKGKTDCTRNVHPHSHCCLRFRQRLASKQAGNSNCQQNLFFHRFFIDR